MRTAIPKYFRSMISLGLVCLAAAVTLSSCSKKPQEQIIGKWMVQGQTNTMEFRADGTMTALENGKETPAKYSFVDQTNLQMELSLPAGTNKLVVRLTFELAIHGDTADLSLTLPGKGGAPGTTQTTHLTRAK